MKKVLVIGGISIAVLAVVGAVVVVLALDSIVKKGVETIGPKVAKVEVRLDQASIHPLLGSGKLSGLFIGSPEGYKTESAIKVGSASMALQGSSLLSDKIVIDSIVVESPEITYEGGLSDSNLKTILKNVQSVAGDSQTSGAKSSGSSKKLQVNLFRLTGAKVQVKLTTLGGTGASLSIPDIELRDLGTGSDGITPESLTSQILQKVLDGTIQAVVQNAGKLGSDALKGATGAGKDATDQLQKTTKGVTDLFKKKK